MQPFGSEFWNARFDTEDYVFGREPAVFLREHAHHIPPGSRVLVPADGEGRNSVFLAQQGHEVHATDIAEHGIAKARKLAGEHGVEVAFHQVDVHEWDWPEAAYDAVAAVFIQFSPPQLRPRVFAGIERALRPGGVLLLHGYTTKQIEYGTGGPPRVEHLYTQELLRDAFAGWEIVRLEAYERELEEGSRHVGRSALIDLIARRV